MDLFDLDVRDFSKGKSKDFGVCYNINRAGLKPLKYYQTYCI